MDSLYPRYAGGQPRTFNLPQRQEVKKIAKSKPVEHGLPFSTWGLSKLADFLVAEGVVDDISPEGPRVQLRYFALDGTGRDGTGRDGTDHASDREQGGRIRRYIIWRNHHADDTRLQQIVARANVA